MSVYLYGTSYVVYYLICIWFALHHTSTVPMILCLTRFQLWLDACCILHIVLHTTYHGWCDHQPAHLALWIASRCNVQRSLEFSTPSRTWRRKLTRPTKTIRSFVVWWEWPKRLVSNCSWCLHEPGGCKECLSRRAIHQDHVSYIVQTTMSPWCSPSM